MKHLDVTIVTSFQFLLELLNSRGVLAKKVSTAKEVATLSIVLVTFNAIENKEGKHLIFEETPIMIMKKMPSPFLWTMLTSLDAVQVANASREEPGICITEYQLIRILLAR